MEIVDGGSDAAVETSNKSNDLTKEKEGDLMEDHDKTEENVYPGTHWTLWILGLISIAALVAFAMHLTF